MNTRKLTGCMLAVDMALPISTASKVARAENESGAAMSMISAAEREKVLHHTNVSTKHQ